MADEEVEEEAGGAGQRKTCTLYPATIKYLDELVAAGTHGSSLPRVMSRLIEEGVRGAIKDGFIKPPR